MDIYLVVTAWAERSGMSASHATALCRQGKIQGAVKEANLWLVPESAVYKLKSPKRPRKRRPTPFDGWTEAQFQAHIVRVARELGWEVYHSYSSRRSEPGFPDLVLVKERTLFREIKTEKGRLTAAQIRWLNKLTQSGEDAEVWRPGDWERIQGQITGGDTKQEALFAELATPRKRNTGSKTPKNVRG